jgi:hypothetical protein
MLQRNVFYCGIVAYAVSLLAGLAMVVAVVVNFLYLASIDIMAPAIVFAISSVFRLILALWLKQLGGTPPGYLQK